MKKETLNQLKSDYDKREIKPSADLWDRIEQGMDKAPVLSSKKSFEWIKYAAVILLLVSFGVIFYINSNSTEKNNNTFAEKHQLEKNIEKENLDIEIINSTINKTENNIAVSHEINKQQTQPENTIKIVHENSLPETNHYQLLSKEENQIINKDNFNTNPVVQEKIIIQNIEKPLVAERKKTNYIKADELLLGREFDKTREESQDHHKTFGVVDMGKIKIKSPNSFKILGMTVFSDSLESK